jgi:hypothetical protein
MVQKGKFPDIFAKIKTKRAPGIAKGRSKGLDGDFPGNGGMDGDMNMSLDFAVCSRNSGSASSTGRSAVL